jgi:ribosomal-protein-alanine N-acetyltransferase
MTLPSIRTPRILLRPWVREDIDALHALWMAPEVRRYLWDDVVISTDMAAQVVESQLASADQHGIGCWAICIPPDVPPQETAIAGFCGFRFIDDGPDAELLYALRGEHWGRGLATEACTAALDYFWRSTRFQQVYARTDSPNSKSVGVMLRLGMTLQSATASTITYVLQRPV